MSAAWDNQRTKPINVYGPPRTEELVKAAVQYFSISAEIRIADGGRTIPIDQLFFGHDVSPGVISLGKCLNLGSWSGEVLNLLGIRRGASFA